MGDLSSTIKAVQRAIGVKADGVAGPVTWAGIAKVIDAADFGIGTALATASPSNGGPGAPVSGDSHPATNVFDSRSEGNIAGLNLVAQVWARKFLRAVWDDGINARIISGYRTYEEQAQLYAKYKAGGPVAAPPGHSNHNFGLAWDIGIFDGDGRYLESSPLYAQAGSIGKDLGLIWGGDWSNGDEPHFEFRPLWAHGLSESEALAAYRTRQAKGESIV